jgi:hypothetical protein
MKKHLIKRGKRIVGFVYQRSQGQWCYAFGRPSQDQYITFDCDSLEQGIARVEMHTNEGSF